MIPTTQARPLRWLVAAIAIAVSTVGCGPRAAKAPTANARPGDPASEAPADRTHSECSARLPKYDSARTPEAFLGKKIRAVCFVGVGKESETRIRGYLRARAGATLTTDLVRDDLRRLVRREGLVGAEVIGARGNGDITLTYVLEPNKRIHHVEFHGSRVFGDRELSKIVPFEKDRRFDPRELRRLIQILSDEYVDRGYERANVQFEAKPYENDRLVVHVNIEEGPQSILRTIRFEGNKHLKNDELTSATKLEIGKVVLKDLVERATLLVQALAYDRGLAESTVTHTIEGPSERGDVGVVFTLDEGPVYRIGSIAIEPKKFEKKAKLQTLSSKRGQIFSRAKLVADQATLRSNLGDEPGLRDIVLKSEIDKKKRRIDIVFSIETGGGPIL